MISDRELSELVAEKVMGWSRPGADMAWSDSDGYRRGLNPSFATDAGLALEAAMKARDGESIEIVPQSSGKFLIPFYHSWEPNNRTYGNTVASALCLAALRSAGVEVEDDTEKEERGEMG